MVAKNLGYKGQTEQFDYEVANEQDGKSRKKFKPHKQAQRSKQRSRWNDG